MNMAPAQDFVRRTEAGGVVTLTLSHPETLNRFSSEAQFLELAEHIRHVNTDADARVLIITGQGSAFCAGGDLNQMAMREGFSAGDVAAVQARYRATVHQLPTALNEVDIPTIAAVNGPAYGAGPIDAHEAKRIGLVSQVVADDVLQEEVNNVAQSIARHPGQALRMNKRLLREAEQFTLPNHLDLVAAFQAIAHASDEHVAAVRGVLHAMSERK